jgi:hypothetical protein
VTLIVPSELLPRNEMHTNRWETLLKTPNFLNLWQPKFSSSFFSVPAEIEMFA